MRRVAWYQKRAQLNLAYRAWQAIQGFKKPEECRNAHCLTSKSHDVTPLYCYGNGVKKTVAILWYKTLKWRLYCCTKQRTVERSRLIILSLRWPFWCTPKKNSEEISPQVREPAIFLLWIWILGLWNLDYSSRPPESHQRSESGIQVPETENPESIKHFPHAETFFVAWIVHSCWPRGWKWLFIYLTCVTEYDL